MKYYFNYEVYFKYKNGKSGKLNIRADNPVHLKERFRKKYPNRTLTKFIAKDTLQVSFLSTLSTHGYTEKFKGVTDRAQ